ncbi:hypothetical protein IFM89_036524 [Coptis chinensis]|uniref:SWIM-type domain-containing protein n=1 Tax=Coptis chinensis TaxID=261450 RepID=A0A835H9U8_9MAGN|nr:hypothetical protein IFM89_036524 [Coptis chinensis]
MGDRKNLKIHYAGSFSKRRNGEKLSHLDYRSKYPVKEILDVDSDELNMIDFAADVSLPSHMSKLDYMNIKLFYLVSGKQVYVNSDSGLLGMFDLLGYCHVFVENDMGESVVPPSQEYDETMCTLMDLKKLIKKRALNANDKGNSMQKKNKSFNDKGFGSKQNKKSGKDKGEAKGKKKSTTHIKGEIVMPTCSDEWKVGMEWPDIETPRHEISDYCIKNRFEVDMRTINERENAKEWDEDGLVPQVEKRIKELIKKVHWYHVESSNEVVISVKTENGTRFCVNLVDHECSCMRWQLSGIVCVHAVAVLYPRRVYWKEYCSSYYWVSTYKLAYMGHIMPMPDMSEWPMNCTCKGLPAAKKDKHGKKSQEETQASQASAPIPDEALESTEASQASSPTQASSSKAAKRVCSKCNHPGHNAKTCKGLPTAKKDKHDKKSQKETQASQDSAPVSDEAKKSTQGSQVSAPVPEEALESTQSASSKAAQRVWQPIATKGPRPHGPGSTSFMPKPDPKSLKFWVPPGQVGDALFKATKKILPPLAPGPLPTSRKKFQVVRPK